MKPIFLFAAFFATIMISSIPANANCIRQSFLKHDYCGPEGKKLRTFLVADKLLGPFRQSCYRHDVCYGLGAEDIVKKMEKRYRMSMVSMSSKQKREFEKEMGRVKKDCDNKFLKNLQKSCSKRYSINRAERTSLAVKRARARCYDMAELYHFAVRKIGKKAFLRSIESAFTCRSR